MTGWILCVLVIIVQRSTISYIGLIRLEGGKGTIMVYPPFISSVKCRTSLARVGRTAIAYQLCKRPLADNYLNFVLAGIIPDIIKIS